jgi:hypothetical protein
MGSDDHGFGEYQKIAASCPALKSFMAVVYRFDVGILPQFR